MVCSPSSELRVLLEGGLGRSLLDAAGQVLDRADARQLLRELAHTPAPYLLAASSMSATEVLLLEGKNARRKDFDRTLGAERTSARRLDRFRGIRCRHPLCRDDTTAPHPGGEVGNRLCQHRGMRRTARPARWLTVFASAAIVLVVAWRRVFVQGLVPIDGNTLTFAYPTWRVFDLLVDGWSLPLWNPYRGMGEPFLADPQTLAAYPAFWLLAGLDDYQSFLGWWIALHSALAACFMGLLVWKWLNQVPAVAAAVLIIGLNGFFIARVTFPNHFAAAAWLPAILYFQTRGSARGLGACFAMQWLAGFPPFVLLGVVAATGIASVQGRSGLVRLAGGGAWGLGLAACQLLPFAELLAESRRQLVLSAEMAAQFSIPPAQLLSQLVIPQWLGWSREVEGDSAIVSFYVGIAALLLAAVAVARGAQLERRIGLAVLASLGLSFGAQLPGFELVRPLHVFRFPANWLLLGSAGLALLAASGIRHLPGSRWKWLAVSVIGLDLLLYTQQPRVAWAAPSFFEEPPALAQEIRRSNGPTRIYHSARLMQLWQAGQLESQEDYAVMVDFLAPSHGMAYGIQEASSMQTLRLDRASQLMRRMETDPSVLDWAGVEWVVSIDREAQRVDRSLLRVLRNRNARARLFDVDAGASDSEVEIELTRYRAGAVEAVTRSDREARVVLSEIDHPGWEVRIDGEPVAHQEFEGAFIEVAVPEGSHRLSFDYRPASFRIGVAVSISTLLLWAVAGWWRSWPGVPRAHATRQRESD
jgi:hypothetical protein